MRIRRRLETYNSLHTSVDVVVVAVLEHLGALFLVFVFECSHLLFLFFFFFVDNKHSRKSNQIIKFEDFFDMFNLL